MSIIHDALKKVQLSLQKPTQGPVENIPSNPYAPPVILPPEPEKKPKSPLLLVLLTITIIFSIAAYLFYSPPKFLRNWVHTQVYPLESALMHKYKIGAQPIAAFVSSGTKNLMGSSKPMATAPAAVDLNIQGIMTNNGSAVALINGKIYQAGDDIAGTKLVSIGENSITVLRDGKAKTIQLRH